VDIVYKENEQKGLTEQYHASKTRQNSNNKHAPKQLDIETKRCRDDALRWNAAIRQQDAVRPKAAMIYVMCVQGGTRRGSGRARMQDGLRARADKQNQSV
jgi:hypothetical protein